MLDMATLGERLRAILNERIEAGTLVLPALPEAAIALQSYLDNPEADATGITNILQRDPILTTQVLRIANSPLHRRGSPVDSLQRAVTLLGQRALKQVLVETVARRAFKSRHPHINATLVKIWEHSMAVAWIARKLATVWTPVASSENAQEDSTDEGTATPKADESEGDGKADESDDNPTPLNSETLFLSGLLHDVGKAVVALYLMELERALPVRTADAWLSAGNWMAVVDDLHRPIGAAVAKSWNLPEEVSRCIEFCDEYGKQPEDGINLVVLANALAKREGLCPGDPDTHEAANLLKRGQEFLGITDEALTEALVDLADAGLKEAA